VVERPDEWMLGYKQREQSVAVVRDRIILSSLCHPSRITFTINLWAHSVTMLKYVNNAFRLRPIKRKPYGCREVSFHKHLGEGYYFTTLYCKHILEFCQHYVWHGEEIHTIYSSKNGISINLHDKWDNFLNNVILSIHHHYPKFANAQPQCGCQYYDEDCHLGWKACTICYPFGHDSNLEDSDECIY